MTKPKEQPEGCFFVAAQQAAAHALCVGIIHFECPQQMTTKKPHDVIHAAFFEFGAQERTRTSTELPAST